MKHEDFQGWVEKNCMHEAFYEDSEGRIILWVMCNKFASGLEETNEDLLRQPTRAD